MTIEPCRQSVEELGHLQRFVKTDTPTPPVWGCLFWSLNGQGGVSDPFRLPFVPELNGWFNDEYGHGVNMSGNVITDRLPTDPATSVSLYTSPNREDVTLFISGFRSGYAARGTRA